MADVQELLDCCQESNEQWEMLLTRLTSAYDQGDLDVKFNTAICLITKVAPHISDSSELCSQIHNKVMDVCKCRMNVIRESATDSNLVTTNIETIDVLLSALPTLTAFTHTMLMCVDTALILCMEVTQTNDHLTVALTTLFKTAYKQLKTCLAMVSSLPTDSAHNKHVLPPLIKVAVTLLNFDPSMLALCWKDLGRLLCKVKGQFPQYVTPVIRELCVAMETKSLECFKDAGCEKLLKVCRFLGSLLVKCVEECVEEATGFYDNVWSCLLALHNEHSLSQAQLQDNILIIVDPLVASLCNCKSFLELLFDVPLDQPLGHLLCLCALIRVFPSIKGVCVEYCLDVVSSQAESCGTCRLLDSTFTSFSQCYVFLQEPVRLRGIMCNGQPQRMVSLYENVISHMCALIAMTPSNYIPSMENCFLRHVLSPWQPVSLLASDVWVYLLRHSSDEVMSRQCCVLIKLLLVSFQPSLSRLLSRFLSLLTSSHQHSILVSSIQNTSTKALLVWASLERTLLYCISPSLIPVCMNIISESQDLSSELAAVSCLSALSLDSLVVVDKTTLINSIIAKAVCCSSIELFSALIEFLSRCSLSYLQAQEVVSLAKDRVIYWCNEPAAIALCTLLQACQPLSEQCISACFHSILTYPSWLVHHLAMEAFKHFAELSQETALIENCVPQGYTEVIVTFLHKTACSGCCTLADINSVLMRQNLVLIQRCADIHCVINKWRDFVRFSNTKLSVRTIRQIQVLSDDMELFVSTLN